MTPEWLHVGLTAVIAILGGFSVWQNTNIKLAISQNETKLENRLAGIKDWAHQTFVSKNQQLSMLEMLANDREKSKT